MITLKQLRIALQIFQSNRLRRDYRDLAEIPQYELVGEFFFSEMYGPRDYTQRDSDARRLQHILHMLPGVHLRDVEQVLELLEMTNRLDDGLARMMLAQGLHTDFDEETYDRVYREADNYDDRLVQLGLIRSCLYNVFRLSRSHLLGMALHRSRMVARLAGFEAGHDFLRKGYDALQGVSSIDLFAETIYRRELARLDHVYERDT
jgi:hypothetical protein